MPLGASEVSIESLQKLLTDALTLNSDPKIVEKLGKCQELASTLSIKSKGILNKFSLDGKVALVTGGGQGIGRGFAHALGEAGCKVAVADMELSRAEIVKVELEAKGIQSIAIKVDVSNKENAEEMVATVLSTWGTLDIACNNAGIVSHSDSENTTKADWDKIFGVNLNGVFFCCQAEAKHMLKKGYGKIINTASISGYIVNYPQNQTAYNTSKAGVVHLTKCLGTEWIKRGVRVNAISPGYVESIMTQNEVVLPMRKIWLQHSPTGRLAEVDDLLGAVLYLASPLSDYMTGHDMIIDGGYTCW